MKKLKSLLKKTEEILTKKKKIIKMKDQNYLILMEKMKMIIFVVQNAKKEY